MTVDALSAANAYRNQLNMMKDAVSAPEQDAAQPSFQQLMETAVKEATGTQSHSEALQMQSLTGSGKVDLSDLVTAVSSAELTLNTVVAVRDRVINAYNDIIKMPI